MKTLKLTMASVLFAIAPVQLAAQITGFSASEAVEAYDRGASSGLSPATQGEFAGCAAAWSEWFKHANGNSQTTFVQGLPDHLRQSGALKAQIHWQNRTKDTFEGGLAGLKATSLINRNRPEPRGRIEAGDRANLEALFEQLGVCQRPGNDG